MLESLFGISYSGLTSGILYRYTMRNSAWGMMADVKVITPTGYIPIGEIKVPSFGHAAVVKAFVETSTPAQRRAWKVNA